MNLSIKQKALLQTFGLLASAVIIGSAAVLLLQYVPLNIIVTGLGVGFAFYMIYLVYQISLSQLRYKETLQEMVDKK